MKFNIREIIRFGIVGIIATIIHYGTIVRQKFAKPKRLWQ